MIGPDGFSRSLNGLAVGDRVLVGAVGIRGVVSFVGAEPYRRVLGMMVEWDAGGRRWFDWNEADIAGVRREDES